MPPSVRPPRRPASGCSSPGSRVCSAIPATSSGRRTARSASSSRCSSGPVRSEDPAWRPARDQRGRVGRTHGPSGAPHGAGGPALDRPGPLGRGPAVPRLTLPGGSDRGTAWSCSGRRRNSARIPMMAEGARSTIGTMEITATFTPPSPKIVSIAAVTDISRPRGGSADPALTLATTKIRRCTVRPARPAARAGRPSEERGEQRQSMTPSCSPSFARRPLRGADRASRAIRGLGRRPRARSARSVRRRREPSRRWGVRSPRRALPRGRPTACRRTHARPRGSAAASSPGPGG